MYHKSLRSLKALSILALLIWFGGGSLHAQRSRITTQVQNDRRVMLRGHLHPRAIPENDQGRVDRSTEIPDVKLVLKPSDAQTADLDKLLAEQQDPSSANYHRWLTPEEYGARFGASTEDIDKMTQWLEQQNLTVTGVARARNSISARGNAASVETAFGTELHSYLVNGETHFANATEPTLPAAFQGVVKTIEGLNNFRMAPKLVLKNLAVEPNFTSSTGKHYLSPDDIATIYNLKPLYAAGIDGSGQKIVVVGQTQVDLTDIRKYRSAYGLPANDPQLVLVPGLRDPGVSSTDLPEADLDLQLTGAVARNASILFVYSSNVLDAVQYAIDQNLAPVLSMSYGLCEALTSTSSASAMQSWARQGNAQGITWLSSSGDSGGADCAGGSTPSAGGLSVDAPASIPEVTGVGGTEFNDGAGVYWNSSNDANGASATSYIPEVAWNDSDSAGGPAAGGGGASVFFLRPSWQVGIGVPNDGSRSVPDVSLSSSALNTGYLTYTKGVLRLAGGTSASTPLFAGIAALVNQRLVTKGAAAGLGNMNPKLYTLAQTAPSAFHDITGGDNIVTVTCSARARNCTAGSFGYAAGPGYDRATGLGSVDASNLVAAWTGPMATRGTASLNLTSSAGSIDSSGSVILTARATGTNGGTPLGNVSFSIGSKSLGTAALTSAGGGASTAAVVVQGAQLVLGNQTVVLQYGGDASYSPASASTVINVTTSSPGLPSITGLTNSASFRQAYAPGMILSIFGDHLAPSTWTGQTIPLQTQLAGVTVTINGIVAPLYYVSPGLLNVQIPYEVSGSVNGSVQVNNNGQTASSTIGLSAAAPGIFGDTNRVLVPTPTAARGQQIALYITGAGSVSPSVPTGSAPAYGTALEILPKPLQSTSVSVANVGADLRFIGNTPGLVGVVQINFVVPQTADLGTQPVVVTIGGVQSAPATITVTP